MRARSWIVAVFLLVSGVGCATMHSTHDLERLSLNMTKDNVQRAIGNPTTVRGALQNKYGQTVEVWEYRLQSMSSAGMILQATAAAMATESPGGTPLPVD